MAVD
jgi:hypothetical protein